MNYNDFAISTSLLGETMERHTSVFLRKNDREDYTKKLEVPERHAIKVSKGRIAASIAPAKEKALNTINWLLPQIDSWDNTSDIEEEIQDIFAKEDILVRISKIVDKLVEDNEVFRGIDKTKLLNVISEMLDEFTPEQMEAFEEAVKRRPLFK